MYKRITSDRTNEPRCRRRQNDVIRRHCCRHVSYHGIHLALQIPLTPLSYLNTPPTITIYIADSPHKNTSLDCWLAGWMVALFIRSTDRPNWKSTWTKQKHWKCKKGNNSNGSRTAKKTTTKTWMYTNKVYFHIHIQCCWLVLNTLKRPTAKLPACLSASSITTAVRNVWFYYSSELI